MTDAHCIAIIVSARLGAYIDGGALPVEIERATRILKAAEEVGIKRPPQAHHLHVSHDPGVVLEVLRRPERPKDDDCGGVTAKKR